MLRDGHVLDRTAQPSCEISANFLQFFYKLVVSVIRNIYIFWIYAYHSTIHCNIWKLIGARIPFIRE